MDKLRALEYFVAAAQAGSFAGAARQLDVSVPSIHKLIASLEAQLGTRLFERTHKGLRLTASGDTYLESCRPLLEELAALDRVVSRSADSPSGTLVIGAPSQLTHHLLLPALPRFRALYPDIQIDFRVVQRPARNSGCVTTLIRNGTFVFTPNLSLVLNSLPRLMSAGMTISQPL